MLVGVSPREVNDVPSYGGGLIPTYGLINVGRNALLLRTPPIDSQSKTEPPPVFETRLQGFAIPPKIAPVGLMVACRSEPARG